MSDKPPPALSIAVRVKDEFSKGLGRARKAILGFGNAATGAERKAGPLARAMQRLSAKAKELGKSFSAAKAAAIGLVGYLTGRLIGALTGTSDAWSQLSGQLRLVTQSQEEFLAVRQKLLDVANHTRTDIEATVDLYASLARSTKGLGLSQQDLVGITQSISEAMKVGNATAAETAASLRQLAQALASGTLRGDEFRSMLEGAPRLIKALTDHLHVSQGELIAMAEAGQLTAQTLIAAFQGQSDKIASEFAVLPKTFEGVFTAIRNDIKAFVGGMDEASGASSRAVEAISRGWEYLKGTLQKNSNAIVTAINAIGATLDVFGRTIRGAFNAVTVAGRILTLAVFKVVLAFKELQATLTIGDASARFQREAQAMRDTIDAIGKDIAQDFRDIGDAWDPKPVESAAKKTGEAVDEAAGKVKNLAEQAKKGVEIKADVKVDQESIKGELARLQRWVNQHPITVPVRTQGGGTMTGNAVSDEMLRRGDL